jgi:hypothetical protein
VGLVGSSVVRFQWRYACSYCYTTTAIANVPSQDGVVECRGHGYVAVTPNLTAIRYLKAGTDVSVKDDDGSRQSKSKRG